MAGGGTSFDPATTMCKKSELCPSEFEIQFHALLSSQADSDLFTFRKNT